MGCRVVVGQELVEGVRAPRSVRMACWDVDLGSDEGCVLDAGVGRAGRGPRHAAQKLLRSWRGSAPPEFRHSVEHRLVLALAFFGGVRDGGVVLLGFHCLLCPAEVWNIVAEDVMVLDAAQCERYGDCFGVVRVRGPNTAVAGHVRVQLVLIENEALAIALQRHFENACRRRMLWPFEDAASDALALRVVGARSRGGIGNSGCALQGFDAVADGRKRAPTSVAHRRRFTR